MVPGAGGDMRERKRGLRTISGAGVICSVVGAGDITTLIVLTRHHPSLSPLFVRHQVLSLYLISPALYRLVSDTSVLTPQIVITMSCLPSDNSHIVHMLQVSEECYSWSNCVHKVPSLCRNDQHHDIRHQMRIKAQVRLI